MLHLMQCDFQPSVGFSAPSYCTQQHTYIVDETRQSDEHLNAYDHVEDSHRVQLVETVCLLDLIEVENTDEEE